MRFRQIDGVFLVVAESDAEQTKIEKLLKEMDFQPPPGFEGFGRDTTGGAGKPVYRVTNLNDSGAGSLRDALSKGDRMVVFDVAGLITLASDLTVKGANITVDGSTAPSPGITLKGRTLALHGSKNVVLHCLRHRGTVAGEVDAIRVYGATNIVLDHLSVSGFGDGGIDITEKCRDVTMQWCMLGEGQPSHNFISLIGYDSSRVSVHHNLFIGGDDRMPHVSRRPGSTELPSEIVGDVRNNLVWNYKTGTTIRHHGTANVINNYYYTSKGSNAERTIALLEDAVAYVNGNYNQNGLKLSALGNRETPFACVEPTTTDALTAAKQVVAQAGARGPRFGLDAADIGYIGQIKSLTPRGGPEERSA